jgi:hypothetical protein
MPKDAQTSANKPARRPILPTVFMRAPVLSEQLRRMCAGEAVNLTFVIVSDDVFKKTGELRGLLHNQRYSPARISPYSLQEAEVILNQAECLLAALPLDSSKVHPEVSKERLCRAVDTVLMLDAAIRALQTPCREPKTAF